jgi:hypothetical protein
MNSFKVWFENNVLSVTSFAIAGLTFIFAYDVQEQKGPILGSYENDLVLIMILVILLLFEKKDIRKHMQVLEKLKAEFFHFIDTGDVPECGLTDLRNWVVYSILEIVDEDWLFQRIKQEQKEKLEND